MNPWLRRASGSLVAAPSCSEKGLTLPEVMVVVVLAGVVTLGLVGFYLSSQATWLDASTQALVQRDATTLVETITREAHEAATAIVLPVGGDSTNSDLLLYRHDDPINEARRFSWDPGDSLVHAWVRNPLSTLVDQGPVVSTTCERFQVAVDD
jgi:prepilin-type N-terminal cleavage/methylation domain-containing protein